MARTRSSMTRSPGTPIAFYTATRRRPIYSHILTYTPVMVGKADDLQVDQFFREIRAIRGALEAEGGRGNERISIQGRKAQGRLRLAPAPGYRRDVHRRQRRSANRLSRWRRPCVERRDVCCSEGRRAQALC